MRVFGNKKEAPKGSTISRVSKMSDTELLSWFNNAIMEVGINFDSWRYHDTPIGELDMSVNSLSEIWTEIKARKHGRDNS